MLDVLMLLLMVLMCLGDLGIVVEWRLGRGSALIALVDVAESLSNGPGSLEGGLGDDGVEANVGGIAGSLLHVAESLSDGPGGLEGSLGDDGVESDVGDIAGSLLGSAESLSNLLGSLEGVLGGDTVGSGGGSLDRGVGIAINLALNSLIVLQAEGHAADLAFEAELVIGLLDGVEAFEGISGLLANRALLGGHLLFFRLAAG